MKELNCDYLIVGAGAAGCVVSNRLSHTPNNSVICIEAGGKDNNFYIKIPAGFSKTVYNDKITGLIIQKNQTTLLIEKLDFQEVKF